MVKEDKLLDVSEPSEYIKDFFTKRHKDILDVKNTTIHNDINKAESIRFPKKYLSIDYSHSESSYLNTNERCKEAESVIKNVTNEINVLNNEINTFKMPALFGKNKAKKAKNSKQNKKFVLEQKLHNLESELKDNMQFISESREIQESIHKKELAIEKQYKIDREYYENELVKLKDELARTWHFVLMGELDEPPDADSDYYDLNDIILGLNWTINHVIDEGLKLSAKCLIVRAYGYMNKYYKARDIFIDVSKDIQNYTDENELVRSTFENSKDSLGIFGIDKGDELILNFTNNQTDRNLQMIENFFEEVLRLTDNPMCRYNFALFLSCFERNAKLIERSVRLLKENIDGNFYEKYSSTIENSRGLLNKLEKKHTVMQSNKSMANHSDTYECIKCRKKDLPMSHDLWEPLYECDKCRVIYCSTCAGFSCSSCGAARIPFCGIKWKSVEIETNALLLFKINSKDTIKESDINQLTKIADKIIKEQGIVDNAEILSIMCKSYRFLVLILLHKSMKNGSLSSSELKEFNEVSEKIFTLGNKAISISSNGNFLDLVYIAFSDIYLYQSKYDQAVNSLRAALKINPNNSEAANKLSSMERNLAEFRRSR